MAVCGCGQTLVGSPPIVDGGTGDDQGILVTGTFDNTIITAVDATAWRPFDLDDVDTNNFTLGNGEFEGRYLANGYNITMIMSFRFGTTSSFGGGIWSVGTTYIPQDVTGIMQNHGVLGTWSAFDDSAASPWFQGTVYRDALGDLGFRFGDDLGGSNTSLQQGTPFTFVAGDEFSFQVDFEADAN